MIGGAGTGMDTLVACHHLPGSPSVCIKLVACHHLPGSPSVCIKD